MSGTNKKSYPSDVGPQTIPKTPWSTVCTSNVPGELEDCEASQKVNINKGGDYADVKDIILAIQKFDPHEEPVKTFTPVSASDFSYILTRIGDEPDSAFRFTFYPTEQQLLITMPTDAHESPISAMIGDIYSVIRTFRYHKIISVLIHSNKRFRTKEIVADPDFNLCISSVHSPFTSLKHSRSLWIGEFAFAETDKHVTKKLNDYVHSEKGEDILVISKVLIREKNKFMYPTEQSQATCTVKREGAHNYCTFNGTANYPIIALGHTFFDLASVEMHVWIRDEEGILDLSNRSDGVYASATIFPHAPDSMLQPLNEILLAAVTKIRQRIFLDQTTIINALATIGLTANEVVAREPGVITAKMDLPQPPPTSSGLSDVPSWNCPFDTVIDWVGFRAAMHQGLWNTAADRYQVFIDSLMPKHSAEHHRGEMK